MIEPNKETVRVSLPATMPIRRLPPNLTPDLMEARSPKKETARINILPSPTPLASAPPPTTAETLPIQAGATTPVTPFVVNSRPVIPMDPIPRPLCWMLAGISTVIFLIQIWNYLVS